MKVFVNEKEYDFEGSKINLNDLLAKLEMNPGSLVAELDGEAFASHEFAGKVLSDGSSLELMKIVGGG